MSSDNDSNHAATPSQYSITDAAIEQACKGVSVIPVGDNKRPIDKWKQLQGRIPSESEIRKLFSNPKVVGLAAVCGKVSGGLECLDFDDPAKYQQWFDRVGERGIRLPVQRTGGGGFQVFYRCDNPAGNAKLAYVRDVSHADGREIAIETRGEGGYAIIAPSLHPSGNYYAWIDELSTGDAPHLTDAERGFFWFTARSLNDAPYGRRVMEKAEKVRAAAKSRDRCQLNGELSVIDEWNEKYVPQQMLESYGYIRITENAYSRPGKDIPTESVYVFPHRDTGRLGSYHHSTNDPLSNGHHNDAFDIYCEYKHGGDVHEAVAAAARELGRDYMPQMLKSQQTEPESTKLQPEKHPPNRLITRRASDIQTKPIEWFYDQRVPANSISLLIGMPNTGKSTVLMDWTARVTNGTPWPVGDNRRTPQGSVLILSAEDQPEHIIVPRLKAAGADLCKVSIIDGVRQLTEEEASDGKVIRTSVDVGRDAELLEQHIDELGDVKLIIIDPLDSYIGSSTDVFRGNEARAALDPIKVLAEERGVTVLICHHFNKAPTNNALDRVSGARSFGALPRSVWITAADESEPGSNRTILAPAKWNMSRSRPSALAYTMKPSPADPDIACIAWDAQELDIGASELMASIGEGRESDTLREAKQFLVSLLALGEMKKTEVQERAKEAGVNHKTLAAAAGRLEIRKRDVRDDKGRVLYWMWSLP